MAFEKRVERHVRLDLMHSDAYYIWNLLHDGSIVAFEGECPGNISVKVEIEYLCEVLAVGSTFLWVHLHGCSTIAYIPFNDSTPITDLTQLRDCDLEILSAKNEEGHISVCCTDCILHLNYVDATCELDNGASVTFATLFQACKQYWDELGTE